MEALAIYELANSGVPSAIEDVPPEPLRKGQRLLMRLKERDWFEIDGVGNKFSDTVWDFKPLYEQTSATQTKITFQDAGCFTDLVKLYCFDRLAKTSDAVATIYDSMRNVCAFLRAADAMGCGSLAAIPYSLYRTHFEEPEPGSSYGNLLCKRGAMLRFLRFYELNFEALPDRRWAKLLSRRDGRRVKAEREAGKTPAIPPDYLEELLAVCARVAYDPDALYDDRVIAGAVILYSQTGCRTCELGTFTVDGIGKMEGEGRGEDLWFARFSHPKRRDKPRGQWTSTTCYLNKTALSAFRLLEELCADSRKRAGTNALIVFASGVVLGSGNVSGRYHRFVFRNLSLPEFRSKHAGKRTLPRTSALHAAMSWFNRDERGAGRLLSSVGLSPDDVLVYPEIRMFRNTVCTELYRKKVSLEWIKRHLNHLYLEMTSYYNRADADIDRAFSNAVYDAILGKGQRLLGPNADAFVGRVEAFLDKEGFAGKVHSNLDEAIQKASKRYPLKMKHLGMCISCANIVPCPTDSLTDEIMCSYGICPNQCFFYWMAPGTYDEVADIAKVVAANLEGGYAKEARHELSKLQRIVAERFEPELSELRREIGLRGAEEILGSHPDLERLISRLAEIEREVAEWKAWRI